MLRGHFSDGPRMHRPHGGVGYPLRRVANERICHVMAAASRKRATCAQHHGDDLRPQRNGTVFPEVADVGPQARLAQQPVVEPGRGAHVERRGEQQKRRRGQQRNENARHTQRQREAARHDSQNFHAPMITKFAQSGNDPRFFCNFERPEVPDPAVRNAAERRAGCKGGSLVPACGDPTAPAIPDGRPPGKAAGTAADNG